MKRAALATLAALWVWIAGPAAWGGALYWIDNFSVYRADLDGSDPHVMDSPYGIPTALAIDQKMRKLYCTSFLRMGRVDWPGWIHRSNMDGSGSELLLYKWGGSVPFQAIDIAPAGRTFPQGKMYWLEQGGIQRADLDGSHEETLLRCANDDHSALALDLDGERVYWTHGPYASPGTPLLECMNLDGTGRMAVATGLTGLATGIAIDAATQRIYFAHHDPLIGGDLSSAIRSCNFDGSGLETVVAGIRLPDAISLDPIAGKIYWAGNMVDQFQASIWRSNLDGTDVEPVIQGISSIEGLAVDPMPVPEPATGVGLGAAIALLVRRRRT